MDDPSGGPFPDAAKNRRYLKSRSDSVASGSSLPNQIVVPVYEKRLDRDPRWALSEGSRHFEEKSAV
jgi:hypothetical protein